MLNYLRSVEKSQTLLLNEQSRNLESSGQEVFKFGFGQSPFPPMARAIEALKAHAHRKEYSPVQGIAELREAVAKFHREIEHIDITADRVLIAPGSKILIYSVMAAFTEADILIPTPAWVSYQPQAELLGHASIRVETSYEGRWRVTSQAIENAVRQKKNKNAPSILIFNYPGNPEGLTYSESELKTLADTFRKHNILVVSDEIYGLLNHRGQHQSLARYYSENTIVTGGLSKWCGAGGWRLGIALLPKNLGGDFKDTLLGIASETYSCAALPVQLAAIEAYKNDKITQDYLAHQRRILARIGAHVQEELSQAGLLVHAPQGGFYVFVDFSAHQKNLGEIGVKTSHELCARLLADTGVALLPGDAFGMASEHLSARLAYVEFDGVAALAASEKIGLEQELPSTFLQTHADKTLRGISRLRQWFATLAITESTKEKLIA